MQGEPDLFVRKGMQLLVDGNEPDEIRHTLEVELDSRERFDLQAGKVLEAMGGYSPTIGIIGAVMGLIHVMQNLSDPSKLGSGIENLVHHQVAVPEMVMVGDGHPTLQAHLLQGFLDGPHHLVAIHGIVTAGSDGRRGLGALRSEFAHPLKRSDLFSVDLGRNAAASGIYNKLKLLRHGPPLSSLR